MASDGGAARHTCRVEVTIRSTELIDLRRLQDIGMDSVAEDAPPSLDVLIEFQRRGCCWVAVEECGSSDQPIAYVLVNVVDQAAHVEQVSVHPKWARRGIGRQLLQTAAGWASSQGLTWLESARGLDRWPRVAMRCEVGKFTNLPVRG